MLRSLRDHALHTDLSISAVCSVREISILLVTKPS